MELKRCNNCANGAWICKESALPEVCLHCNFLSDGSPSEWKPNVATNADRIRAMTDEELVELLCGGYGGFDCSTCKIGDQRKCDMECKEHCKLWLQQPAEGDA